LTLAAIIVTTVAGLYLAASIVVFGRRTPGYRHGRNTISELGEIGAPHQHAIAYRVFLPVGVLLLAAAGLLVGTSQAAAGLAFCIAVGYLVAAFFPCDPGSPVSGSARQGVHNLGGAVEYVGGGIALLSLADTHGGLFRLAAFAAFGAALLLTILPSTSVRGLVQRLAEACLFVALVAAAANLHAGA